MTTNITLIGAAKVFDVHPRTIVRALSGDHNTYWYEDIDEHLYSVADIAAAYGITAHELVRCIEGRDELIKPNEAALLLNIEPRTFRKRVKAGQYKRAACGGVVRYFKSKILEDLIRSSGE